MSELIKTNYDCLTCGEERCLVTIDNLTFHCSACNELYTIDSLDVIYNTSDNLITDLQMRK